MTSINAQAQAQQARELYALRDKLQSEITQIDNQLNKLRALYMTETNTYGIHPIAFRRAVESIRNPA